MNDFIGNNIKLIINWGQSISGLFVLSCLFLGYLLVRKNRYFLPKGILASLAFTGLLLLGIIGSLVFLKVTDMRPKVRPILNQLESLIGNPAPPLAYQTVQNDASKNIQQQKDTILLVNFWATWCAPCIKEIPDLKAIEEAYHDQAVKVVMISDEKPERINSFMKKHDLDLEVGYTQNFDWAPLGNERPATFLVNREGIITHYFTGPHDFDFFEKKLKKIL